MKHRQFVNKEVDIIETSKDGYGLGYIDYPEGKRSQVEVPFAIEGDRVNATLLGKNKKVYRSRIDSFIEKSQDRIEPRCVHFGSCGGCRWQQISYEQELARKNQFILDCLASHLNEKVVIYPIISCLPPWNYRNKIEVSFSSDKANNRYLGFMMVGGRRHVFRMEECHLVNPWMVEAVKAVDGWWEESGLQAYHAGKNTGSLRTLTLREGRRSGDRLAMLTVSGNPDFSLNKHQLDRFVCRVREAVEPVDPNGRLSIFLRIQQIAKGRKTNFYEMVLYGPDHIRETLYIKEREDSTPYRLSFKISPMAFFQPNTEQAERLYSRALQLAQIPKDAIVYDLYCGTGTLGICAAYQAKEVIGIEIVPESVVDARENIKLNRLSNATIIAGDVGQALTALLAQDKPKPDVVFVDPPRAGLDSKTIQHLIDTQAPTLVYISCNPVTQAANLDALLQNGYALKAVQPVDQFPHTGHVENIVVLKYESTSC